MPQNRDDIVDYSDEYLMQQSNKVEPNTYGIFTTNQPRLKVKTHSDLTRNDQTFKADTVTEVKKKGCGCC